MARFAAQSLMMCTALLAGPGCSDALETVDILGSGVGSLIKTEPIEDSNNLNCTYRRSDGLEWTEQKVGECPATDTNYR